MAGARASAINASSPLRLLEEALNNVGEAVTVPSQQNCWSKQALRRSLNQKRSPSWLEWTSTVTDMNIGCKTMLGWYSLVRLKVRCEVGLAAVALLASGVTLTNRWHSPQGQPREGWSDAGACVNVHAP